MTINPSHKQCGISKTVFNLEFHFPFCLTVEHSHQLQPTTSPYIKKRKDWLQFSNRVHQRRRKSRIKEICGQLECVQLQDWLQFSQDIGQRSGGIPNAMEFCPLVPWVFLCLGKHFPCYSSLVAPQTSILSSRRDYKGEISLAFLFY